MTRHIVLGNQSYLINIDEWLQVRDIYFPHVGQENHLVGHAQRVGVFVDGKISWVNQAGWKRVLKYGESSLATDSSAVNESLDVSLGFEENVSCENDVFIRKITVKNRSNAEREIKVFFNHDFHLYGDGIGDTVVYQMDRNVVVHYKRSRYFLAGILKHGGKHDLSSDIDDYAVGTAEEKNARGTIEDAADGVLSRNPVAQGSVDSTIGVNLKLKGNEETSIYYYLAAGQDFKEVYKLHDLVCESGPSKLLDNTEECQEKWVSKTSLDLSGLDDEQASLFKRSLLIIKTQTDSGGAILAANDSDNMMFNKDTYSYMWPRDGALVSIAMIKAGFAEFTKPFFNFCAKALWDDGCMLHKYNPDGTLGSSWHAWIEHGKPALPIQEDETALVLVALWEYYQATEDADFIKKLYKPFVVKVAGFLDSYRYPNELPRESHDLWEERRGIFTFTCCAVYAGLVAAEHLGAVVKDKKTCEMCHVRYEKLREAIISELFDKSKGVFTRGVSYTDGDMEKKVVDNNLDASLYALFEFGVLPADDERVETTMNAIEEKLWVPEGKGGLARYEGDYYHRISENSPGNPWIICTLWLAKWYIAKKDLKHAKKLIDWAVGCSLSSGVMPEQVHPVSGEPLSVSPLTWSHAEFIDVVTKYVEKQNE